MMGWRDEKRGSKRKSGRQKSEMEGMMMIKRGKKFNYGEGKDTEERKDQ